MWAFRFQTSNDNITMMVQLRVLKSQAGEHKCLHDNTADGETLKSHDREYTSW